MLVFRIHLKKWIEIELGINNKLIFGLVVKMFKSIFLGAMICFFSISAYAKYILLEYNCGKVYVTDVGLEFSGEDAHLIADETRYDLNLPYDQLELLYDFGSYSQLIMSIFGTIMISTFSYYDDYDIPENTLGLFGNRIHIIN